MRLEAKTAIITGGASGIGAAVVRRFAHEGADVTLAHISEAGVAVAEAVRTLNATTSSPRSRTPHVSRT